MHSVVWFKKDLRLSDHAPMAWAAAHARQHGGGVVALWVYEPAMWQQSDASARHLGFANECLAELQTQMAQSPPQQAQQAEPLVQAAQHGGPLLRCHGDMLEVLAQLKLVLGSFALVSHEETGNGWSYARDKAVAAWCTAQGIVWRQFPSNAVVRALHVRGGGRDRWSAHWAARMKDVPLAVPQDVPWLLERHASTTGP
jgi:deoxyribodipyrimidine photo-lyase